MLLLDDKFRRKAPKLITPRRRSQTPRNKTNAEFGLLVDPPSYEVVRPHTAEGTYNVAPFRARSEIAQALHTRTPEARLRRLQAALDRNQYMGHALDRRRVSRMDLGEIRSARGEAKILSRQLGLDPPKTYQKKKEEEKVEVQVSAEEATNVALQAPALSEEKSSEVKAQEEVIPDKAPTGGRKAPSPPPVSVEQIAMGLWAEAFATEIMANDPTNDTQENDFISSEIRLFSQGGLNSNTQTATLSLSTISLRLEELYLQSLNGDARIQAHTHVSGLWRQGQEGTYMQILSGPWVQVDHRDDGGMIFPGDVYEFVGPPETDVCELNYYAAIPPGDFKPTGGFHEPVSAPLVFSKVKAEHGHVAIIATCEFPGGRHVQIAFTKEANSDGLLSIEPALSAQAAGAGACPSLLKLEVVLEAALGKESLMGEGREAKDMHVQVTWPQWWLGLKTLLPPAVLDKAGIIWAAKTHSDLP